MKKINSETMGSWNLLEILERVSWPDFPEVAEPRKKVAPDEKPFGVVASLVARNFYGMGEMVNRPAGGISLPRAVVRHRGAALNELFWLTVIEEHPMITKVGADIREGWALVATAKEGASADDGAFAHPDSLLRTYGSRIIEIFSGKAIEVSGQEILEPRAESEGLLHVVEDARLRSLRLLRCQLKAEERQQTPAGLDVDDPKSCEAWSEQISPAEARKVFRRINEYRQALDRLDTIFFAAVRDTMPNGHAVARLAMRKNWEIVETKPPSRIVSAGVMAIPIGLGGHLDLDDALVGSDLFASFLREQGKR